MIARQKAKLCTLLTTTLLSIAPVYGAGLEDFFVNFKQGNYPAAAAILEKLNTTDSSESRSYLLGLTYARMQEYDKAIAAFEKAINEKNTSKDLHYEYGQALYAANELKKARTAFKTSAELAYNKPASLYYIAHISQILEEFDISREYYLLVLKEKETDLKMKQIAQFQLAETLLSIAREKSPTPDDLNRRVERFILPMMRTAQKVDLSTPVAYDITNRLNELMQEFSLDPDQMANGRRLNPKRLSGYVLQKMKFDDNISNVSEENNVTQSRKESFIFESEAYIKNDFSFNKRYIVSPEARLTYIQHSDQSSPEVYTNDSTVLNLALKNKYEHTWMEKPASLIFDVDYSRTYKDWQLRRSRDIYANAVTFTLGESFSFFSFGDSTVKLKRKDYKGENAAISNKTTSLTFDQTAFLPTQHLVIFLFDASFIDNFNNSATNTNTFLARVDYLIPEIYPTWTLDIAFAGTITDTKAQKATRGTEKTLNPSLDLSKELNKNWKIGFNYDFTKNSSNDPSYDYSKSVFTTELRFSF